MILLPMKPQNWNAVKEIYEEGIATGNATFETSAPAWEKWNESHLSFARIIAADENVHLNSGPEILGWAALSKVSDRCVYAGVAEVSVYVKSSARGKGVGSSLLDALIKESEANGIWTLTAGIFPENVSSIRLHENAGFRIIGKRELIGKMNGKWRDTFQFERRSKVVGVD